MNQLVDAITKPFLNEQIIKKTVGIYPGRFQPFGPHHKKTYEWLKSQFDDAYIVTTNKSDSSRHPLNFRQKKAHMARMGIPSNKIIQVRNPYQAVELTKKFPENTAVVFAFGQKDAGRLTSGKYFLPYKSKPEYGYKEHGYFVTAPHVSINVGGKQVSGTTLRQLLGNPNIEDNERKKLFKQAFGYFDRRIYSTLIDKFKGLTEDNDVMIFKPTKIRKVNKKSWHDGEDQELLRDKEATSEAISLPIEIGDTVLMGRFKNKKVVVKNISWNEKGDLLINGRSAMKMRIPTKPNIFDVTKENIADFLTTIDVSKLIKEVSASPAGAFGQGYGSNADDGPRYWWGNTKSYAWHTAADAYKLGWKVVDYIMDDQEFEDHDTDYPEGPTGAVTYFPAGVPGKEAGTNVMKDMKGNEAYTKWKEHIKRVIGNIGYKLIDYMDAEESIDDTKYEKLEEVTRTGGYSKDWWEKQLMLLEGGAYGHMKHPFDDWNLTFGDLKNIIDMALSGQLHREDNVTEKLDGQNIMVSWKNGRLIAARNKGHLKNAGANAVTVSGMASMFKGRGNVRNAFVFAVRDLQKAINSLSQKQKDKIFMEGKAFMNLEIIWPASSNVINYDGAHLVFHGALEYNAAGTVIGQVAGSARILEGMIRQVNQNVQKHFQIGKPQFLNVPKVQDFAKRKSYYIRKLTKLQNKYALNDNDTFSLYHQMFWQEWIMNGAKQTDYANLPNSILLKLMKRWAFGDKSYKIADIKKDFKKDYPKFLDWVLTTDKVDVVNKQKENMKPFELLFFELGAEILQNISGLLAVNPDKAVQGIKKQIDTAVRDIRAGGDITKIKKLVTQLNKLDAIGGIKAVVPTEGLVFKYNGNTYKFTGTFAPVNQITGLLKFSR